jgi:hypothetical protein
MDSGIRRIADPTYSDMVKLLNSNENAFIMFEIQREDIEEGNFSRMDKFFKNVDKIGQRLRQNCGISVGGYDADPRELHEIDEVKKYVSKMFHRYPHLLYFINRHPFEYDHWLLASFADEINSMKTSETYGMNSFEVVEKYGGTPPKFFVHMTFYNDKLKNVLVKTINFGKKIGDKDGAIKVASEYSEKFDIEL